MAALEAAIHRKEYFARAARWAAGSSHGHDEEGQEQALCYYGFLRAESIDFVRQIEPNWFTIFRSGHIR